MLSLALGCNILFLKNVGIQIVTCRVTKDKELFVLGKKVHIQFV